MISKEDNHHLFTKTEIRDRLVNIIGIPNNFKQGEFIEELVYIHWKAQPKLNVEKSKHIEHHKINSDSKRSRHNNHLFECGKIKEKKELIEEFEYILNTSKNLEEVKYRLSTL